MFTANFWKAAAERAVKTFAQAASALLVGDGLGVLDINWGDVASVGALASIASILSSIVSSKIGPEGSPSLVEDEDAANPSA